MAFRALGTYIVHAPDTRSLASGQSNMTPTVGQGERPEWVFNDTWASRRPSHSPLGGWSKYIEVNSLRRASNSMTVFSFELLNPILLHYPRRTRMVDLGQWLWESQMPNSLWISSRPASARMTSALDNLRRTRTDSLSRAITLKTSGVRRAPPRMPKRPRPEGYR